jgi:hypothetical protein
MEQVRSAAFGDQRLTELDQALDFVEAAARVRAKRRFVADLGSYR